MAVEIARNALDLERANSTEIDPATPHPVVDLLESQKNNQTRRHYEARTNKI
jgi:CTP synthase